MPRSLTLNMEKDLLLINVLSILLIFAAAFFPDSPIRILIGLPFILFFPGYVLVCVLFPEKKDLDGLERVALSIGLSIAVVPLIGLVLNYTPWGIRLSPTLSSLFVFTLLMSIAATYRRGILPPKARFAPSLSVNVPKWRELSKSDKLMSVSLVACIVVTGGLTAHFASMPRGERFTEFYVLGPEGKIENYPTNLTLGESGTVILGVVNHEYQEVTYRIVIKLDNETIGTIEGIKLKHDEKWEENYVFTPQKAREKMKLEFLLLREGLDDPYRSLHLWISVKPRE